MIRSRRSIPHWWSSSRRDDWAKVCRLCDRLVHYHWCSSLGRLYTRLIIWRLSLSGAGKGCASLSGSIPRHRLHSLLKVEDSSLCLFHWLLHFTSNVFYHCNWLLAWSMIVEARLQIPITFDRIQAFAWFKSGNWSGSRVICIYSGSSEVKIRISWAWMMQRVHF